MAQSMVQTGDFGTEDNWDFSNARPNPDRVLHVEFYNKAVKNEFESSKQGRPIFADVPYIKITTPGIPILNEIHRPMHEGDKRRFPKHWEYFERTQGGTGVVGTPVDQWAFLSKAQAEELKGAKFYSVEMIANASDLQIGSIGMLGGMAPHALRERARQHLTAAAGNASSEHLASELAKRDADIGAMRNQIAGLLAGQPQEPARRRPGRPPRSRMPAVERPQEPATQTDVQPAVGAEPQ